MVDQSIGYIRQWVCSEPNKKLVSPVDICASGIINWWRVAVGSRHRPSHSHSLGYIPAGRRSTWPEPNLDGNNRTPMTRRASAFDMNVH
jgi:hypothetical protein